MDTRDHSNDERNGNGNGVFDESMSVTTTNIKSITDLTLRVRNEDGRVCDYNCHADLMAEKAHTLTIG